MYFVSRISFGKRCSTPFGIIGIHTSSCYVSTRSISNVCSTPFGIIGIHTPTLELTDQAGDFVCSTPFGIIGIHTRRQSRQDLEPVHVLNAFRHHRNSHSASSFRFMFASFRCSTPFGIIGIHTAGGTRHRHAGFCAQRLSASSEFTHAKNHNQDAGVYVRRVHPKIRVLNAFRHHRNSHSPDAEQWAPSAHRAQRLSASSEFTLQYVRKMPTPEFDVLNAFRHHRNSHRVVADGAGLHQ